MNDFIHKGLKNAQDKRDKYLTFIIDNVSYGIELFYVKEIFRLTEIQDYCKGTITLCGIIIPVIDVRLRFKKDMREYDHKTCVIVVEIAETTLGLIVDGVSEVLSIPTEYISEIPDSGNDVYSFIKTIGKSSNGNDVLIIKLSMLD